ncbi:MAG: D-alanyl-D-alanine carboxypeptidase [Clostridia bacterium]|nr:D-alanyl-D-alanine carboxypeptidase [Clostridia bacterium]
MKKSLIVIMAIIILNILSNTAYAGLPDISDDVSYILIDSKTGQVITEQNADIRLRPASTTKIMTAILAFENCKPDTIMNVSKKAVYDIGRGGMHVGIEPGESNLTLENLVNITLIKSANEAANIIAENVGGSKEEFVKMMNKKAAFLGAYNTNFVNPCGKDDAKADREHLSTARDMAMIARHAMTIHGIREIVAKEYYRDMPSTNFHEKWGYFRTTNRLIWKSNEYAYSIDNAEKKFYVNGIKTGYTSAAGNNILCSAVNENGMELIAVVMHVMHGNNAVFKYAKELLKYGFENYSNQTLIDAGVTVKTVDVVGANNTKTVELVTSSDFKSALPLDKSKWNISKKENYNLPLKAPVSKGDKVGYIEYMNNNIVLGRVDIVAKSNIEAIPEQKEENKAFRFTKIIIFLVLTIIILLLIKRFAFLVPKLITKRIGERNLQ